MADSGTIDEDVGPHRGMSSDSCENNINKEIKAHRTITQSLLQITIGGMLVFSNGLPAYADPMPYGVRNDIGRIALKCYHPTGRYGTSTSRGEWPDAPSFNAASSEVIDISWNGGFLGTPYQTRVAVMFRNRNGIYEMMFVLLGDSAITPANPNCLFNRWTAID